jgi:hypothetical protein
MAKIISADELGLIVQKLLGDESPIESAEVFVKMMTEMAQVVTKYCGGEVINPASNFEDVWMIGIHANDDLPSDGGIWAAYDPDGSLGGEK